MKTTKSILSALVVSGASLLAAGPSQAAFDWVFDQSHCLSGNCGAWGNNTSNYTSTKLMAGNSGAPNVTVSGYSNTGSGGDLQQGWVAGWTGIGVRNQGEGTSSPNHSADNSGYVDSVLLDFGGANVSLSQIKMGWTYSDADITLMAYTGGGNPMGGLTSQGYGDLTSNGWTHVGDYADFQNASGKTKSVNGGGYSSSFWLVSAFNTAISSENWSSGNDYFKLYALAGSIPTHQVPEPATLALAAMGLGLIGWSRRRPTV